MQDFYGEMNALYKCEGVSLNHLPSVFHHSTPLLLEEKDVFESVAQKPL